MAELSERDHIIEIVNKLFIYTDEQQWDRLQSDVFADTVKLDMSSLGGDVSLMKAIDICQLWEDNFKELNAINHLAGNFLVSIEDSIAKVFAYATATHYKASATLGQTREFVGTYNIELIKINKSWCINYLKYNLKYMTGNLNLE